jgi:hypothetical protein
MDGLTSGEKRMNSQAVEGDFSGMLKNAYMQGSRNPEGGVATNKERLIATPASW